MGKRDKSGGRKRIGYLALQARKNNGWSMSFLLEKLRTRSSLFATWTPTHISRLEHGQSDLTIEEAPIYADVLNQPLDYFSGDTGAIHEQNFMDKLPESLPLLIRKLEVQLSRLEFVEVPIVDISKLPDKFDVREPLGKVRVSKSDLGSICDNDIKNCIAIKLSTHVADGFGIKQGEHMILFRNPPEIDGMLYMGFYHKEIVVRKIYWLKDKLRMENYDGSSITIARKEFSMSGAIIVSGVWRYHWI